MLFDGGAVILPIAFPFSILIFSSPELIEDTYTLWRGETQLSGVSGEMNMQGGIKPQDEMPEGAELPEGMEFPEKPVGVPPMENGERPQMNGQPPEGFESPGDFEKLEGSEPPQAPDGGRPERPDVQENGSFPQDNNFETSTEFKIHNGGNMFQVL